MSTTHRFAGLLFIALAPLSACMDATGANGTSRDVDSNPLTDEVADSGRPADLGDKPIDLSHLISARATCSDGVGVIHAYTSGPAQELELRMVPVFHAPAHGNGHWIQSRESIVLAPMVHAPSSPTYYWEAEVELGDNTCDDWTNQLEEVRARFNDRFEIGNLSDRAVFGFEPKPVIQSDTHLPDRATTH